MAFEKLTTAPVATDFTSLEEHQSQTPGTFFGAKPVLHLHSANSQLVVSHADLEGQSLFLDLRAASAASTNGPTANGESTNTQVIIPSLDVWVTSQNLLIFSPTTSTGVSLSYPDITLHAIQRLTLPGGPETQGLYMQLSLNASDFTPDEDLQTLEATLVPSSSVTTAALFAAVSACADLNPDPADSDSEAEGGGGDDDIQIGGLPGAGGWITSDNVHEHVDAEGNFIGFGGGALGAGAGTVRAREEDGGSAGGEEEAGREDGGEGGAAASGEETKWRRTE
ncbi:fpd1 benzoylformate decarboxylase [Diplodia corticola]|uniref:Fpd1 benzoylformate decarboxylase n=1 Tax=Diplodia corticola TaxID=236234 RepID=A0A1J9RZ15_9PEZI|nr:fpd1 benzoylformate decarboxylase [Diplodia corticola]OJD33044.1 fpd1 benzoylformate decarboxylase [Diplodia corticola]